MKHVNLYLWVIIPKSKNADCSFSELCNGGPMADHHLDFANPAHVLFQPPRLNRGVLCSWRRTHWHGSQLQQCLSVEMGIKTSKTPLVFFLVLNSPTLLEIAKNMLPLGGLIKIHCWLFFRRSPWCKGSKKFRAISYTSTVLGSGWKVGNTFVRLDFCWNRRDLKCFVYLLFRGAIQLVKDENQGAQPLCLPTDACSAGQCLFPCSNATGAAARNWLCCSFPKRFPVQGWRTHQLPAHLMWLKLIVWFKHIRTPPNF